MSTRIPSIPSKRVKELMQYAENPDNWLDIDIENDIDPHKLRHHGFEIIYSVEYQNNEDEEGGRLPQRHLSFKVLTELPLTKVKEFITRTVKQFGFQSPNVRSGKSGKLHYYVPMFNL